MTPTYEEMLKGSTTWKGDHEGVSYILSHHGHRRGDEYPSAEYHPGTWCYYLLIPEQMYPHRWADFAVSRGEYGGTQGDAFQHDMFDSEITWASSEPYYDRKAARMWDAAKVGCDYGHLWHMERGYPDSYNSVTADAKRTIDAFLRANPDRHVRCDYSGKYDTPDMFYIAVNGRRVHTTMESEIPDGLVTWKRAEAIENAEFVEIAAKAVVAIEDMP